MPETGGVFKIKRSRSIFNACVHSVVVTDKKRQNLNEDCGTVLTDWNTHYTDLDGKISGSLINKFPQKICLQIRCRFFVTYDKM